MPQLDLYIINNLLYFVIFLFIFTYMLNINNFLININLLFRLRKLNIFLSKKYIFKILKENFKKFFGLRIYSFLVGSKIFFFIWYLKFLEKGYLYIRKHGKEYLDKNRKN